MDESIYNERSNMLKKLNDERISKINKLLNNIKLKYKSVYVDKSKYISIPYDKSSKRSIKRNLEERYPQNYFVSKLNNSIHRTIRNKDANDKLI